MDVCGQRVRGRAVLDGNPWRIYRKVSHGQSGGARKRRQRSPADPCRSGAQPVAALAAAVQKNAKRRCISCGRKRLRQIALLATGNERDGRATPKPFALVAASLAGLQFPLDVGERSLSPFRSVDVQHPSSRSNKTTCTWMLIDKPQPSCTRHVTLDRCSVSCPFPCALAFAVLARRWPPRAYFSSRHSAQKGQPARSLLLSFRFAQRYVRRLTGASACFFLLVAQVFGSIPLTSLTSNTSVRDHYAQKTGNYPFLRDI